MIAGANVVTVITMLLVGYSDRINPADHPLLSTVGMSFPLFLLVNMAFLFFWLIFKWRMIWISVLGFVCAYVPISIYMPINAKQEVPEGALKLLSYNVCTYAGNNKYENGFETVLKYLVGRVPSSGMSASSSKMKTRSLKRLTGMMLRKPRTSQTMSANQ